MTANDKCTPAVQPAPVVAEFEGEDSASADADAGSTSLPAALSAEIAEDYMRLEHSRQLQKRRRAQAINIVLLVFILALCALIWLWPVLSLI